MSVKIISNVWDESKAEGGALLVMLALADHANDDGVSWPGMDRIAKRARMDVRRTQRVVNELIESGELYVLRQHGRGHTNLYLVTIGHTEKTLYKVLSQRFDKAPDEASRLTYDIMARRDGEKVSPEPPFTEEKVVSQTEKVVSQTEKVASGAEKVVETALKGGPCTTRTVINRQLTTNEPSEEPAREETAWPESEIWDLTRNQLRLELPAAVFGHLRDSVLVHTGDAAYEIRCIKREQEEVLRLRLNGRVAGALASVLGHPVTVRYVIQPLARPGPLGVPCLRSPTSLTS